MRYIKTENGRAEMQVRRQLALTPYQRKILILCDGTRPIAELAKMMQQEDISADIEQLVSLGLIVSTSAAPAAPASGRAEPEPVSLAGATGEPMTEAARYREMIDLATTLAANLGFTARVKAQLQIERAANVNDLMSVVNLLSEQLADKQKSNPTFAAQLTRLRQLAAS